MNIVLRELMSSRKSLIWWSVGLLAMIAGGMSKYGGMQSSGQSANDLFAAMPKSLQAIFGVSTLDISTALGYYGLIFSYLLLMAAIYAVMLGANSIAKEERDKTSEFLMAKPVSRRRIITSKLAAAIILLFLFNLITFLLSAMMVNYYDSGAEITSKIAALVGGMFLLQLIFLAIGTSIAAVSKRPKLATSIATGILLLTYILSIAVELSSKLENLKYIIPFKYFEAKYILAGDGFDVVFVILSVVIVVVLINATYILYQKRDLNI
ncbi:ABC transporter permease [Peribacillus butanolivorans]|uniref:ABC transporter permease n=1 Tax=Peribacillus butanolivorans TaxID=421767 RepID=UPI0036397C44